MKKKGLKNLTAIKKKYFIKNPELTTDQIQNLLNITKAYLDSLNLHYPENITHSMLQSTISLIFDNQIQPDTEKK